MKIQKSELAQKLNKLKSIVPKKTTQPVLQGILVKGGCLMANNLELSIKARLTGIHPGDGEETFLIPSKAFDLIGSLPDGMVEIRPGDNAITIRAGKIRNKYQTMDPRTFPFDEADEDRAADIKIDGSEVLKAMKRVAYPRCKNAAESRADDPPFKDLPPMKIIIPVSQAYGPPYKASYICQFLCC